MFKSKETWAILAVLLLGYGLEKFSGSYFGYCTYGNPWGRVAYMFQHGNLFHLLCNWFSAAAFVYVLETKYKVERLLVYAIPFACAILGTFGTEYEEMTIGFSGFMFAAVGLYSTFNMTRDWLVTICVVCAINLLLYIVDANVNVPLHMACMAYGFVAGCVYHAWERISIRKQYGKR